MPRLSSLTSSSEASSTAFQVMSPLCLLEGPSISSSSRLSNLNTSAALPVCEINASPVFGEKPKILLSAQRHAFSSNFSMPQSKMKIGLQTMPESRFFFF
jgi:hypothetical protein